MTKDLTQGNPIKLIIMFTIPLILGNVFQQLYSMADTFIVGQTINVEALAAVGATGSISFLIIGFAQGLTSGFAVVTAQEFGSENVDGVRKSVTHSAILGTIITIILTTISVLGTRPLLELLNTPADIIDGSYNYIVVIFWGIGAAVLFNLLSNIIRAIGDSKTPLIFLIIASIINIVLDFAFILGLKMGVAGAGWATVIAQALSGILCILYIKLKFPILHPQKGDWKFNRKMAIRLLKIGLPMAFQLSIIAIGAMAIQGALNKIGTDAVAAFTAASKIDSLATLPLFSLGITMATFTAQNYGANRLDRIKEGVRKSAILSVIIAIMGGILVIVCGRFLVGIFVGQDKKEVIDLAHIFLIINGATYSLLALLFVYRNTLQGLGQSLMPTVGGIMELVMRILVAFLLTESLGFTGVSLANPIAWIGAVVPFIIAYHFTMKKALRTT